MTSMQMDLFEVFRAMDVPKDKAMRADRAHEAAQNPRNVLRGLAEEVAILTRKQRKLASQVYEMIKSA